MTTMPKRDIVIFLGAGFSFDAGLPVMSDFGPQSRVDFSVLEKHASKGEKYAAKMLVDAAKIFYGFQDACRRSPTLTGEDADNLETIFCIAEAMDEADLETIILQNKVYTLSELIEKIQMWLWKIYQQCPLINPDRKNTRKETYIDFLSLLSKADIWKRTTVISTNYDLIFEYMSWKNSILCAYPFKNIPDDVNIINAGHGSKTYIRVDQDDPDVHSVLCKLHGSVNFFENGTNRSDHRLSIAIDLADGRPIGKSFLSKDLPAIFAVDAIWKIRQEHGQYMTPAIIPPTYAKLVGKKWLREVWKHALNALSEAKIILFIGYSMPQTDGFMRALIHAAYVIKKQTKMPDIYVIDPKPHVHHNYFALFGTSYRDIGHYTLKCALETKALQRVLEAAI
jgi:hypothetical protein